MEISRERLEIMLDQYVLRTFGQNFMFRPQQKHVVIDIVEAFFDSTCNLYLLDAPTGSGKSVIAMVVAGFLSEFKMKGYILASDLMLQTQYERDFKKYNLNWGSIKGVDNYTCVVNNEKFSLGDCKIKNVSYEAAESLPCFRDCGYLYSRKTAIKSPVSLLNYSYWLIQRNYVESKMQDSGKGVPFPKRDFTLCDEAHKISEIVQNHFSPRLDERSLEKMQKFRQILERHNIYNLKTSSSRLKIIIANLFREENSEKILGLLCELEMHLKEFIKGGIQMQAHVANTYKNTEVPKEWRFNLGLADWIKDVHCKFEDYNNIISNAGPDSMIKNLQGEQLIFNCLDESYMMHRHFHTQSGFKLLMTATLGDPTSFLKTIGALDARYYRMESHFDYEKSPIYFYPQRRMSFSQKEKTMPWMIKKVDEILDSHLERGIIHSGSYDIASKIFEKLSDKNRKRILVYTNSKEKEELLQRYLNEEGSVLMGPSILEGLDLAADKSRFQIFVKVPFPSLGDKFVSAKINHQPDWYDWKTITSILQGVGRSVRHDNDWALTYILDGCLVDLLKRRRSSFPIEVQKRIKVIKE